MPPYSDPTSPAPHRFPSGAIWLIALGLFFLFGNTLRFHLFYGRFFGPALLIGFGAWLFIHKLTDTAYIADSPGNSHRFRIAWALRGSFWVILTGFIWLLHVLGVIPWSRSWPIYLIAAGVLLLINRSFDSGYAQYPAAAAAPPAAPPVTSTEIAPSSPWHDRPGDSQGGQ
jgi:hypothetical protein